jgi:Acetyltransferase (GNAT) domain
VAGGNTLQRFELGTEEVSTFLPQPQVGIRDKLHMTFTPERAIESGYGHPIYAETLSEFGRPRHLIQSGGWILERGIPGTDARDAMGCYPIFSCSDWSLLEGDLESLGEELVSLILVANPFGAYSKEILRSTFKDLVVPFKEHFVADLRPAMRSFVSQHHRYYARKALETVKVEHCADPLRMVDEWSALYDLLVARHHLTGIKAFSRVAFEKQLTVPGLVMLRASHEGETIGAHLWYVQGDVAFSHLGASSRRGYELMAAYALSWRALEFFTGKVRWIDWGAGAGVNTSGQDGLARFKRGWANTTRTAHLCGRIFDRARYKEISRAKGIVDTHYFPSYRKGEFC